MLYLPEQKKYVGKMFLKQGYYNYQYVFLPKGSTVGKTSTIEGDHWETKNEYCIFVYYREDGEITDKLIGVRKIKKG